MKIVRWGCLTALLIAAACIAAVVILIARPARITGVEPKRLAASIEGELPRNERANCHRNGREAWLCNVTVTDSGGSDIEAERTYRVTVSDWGCWDAEWLGGDSPSPKEDEASGCIGILDYVSIFD